MAVFFDIRTLLLHRIGYLVCKYFNQYGNIAGRFCLSVEYFRAYSSKKTSGERLVS